MTVNRCSAWASGGLNMHSERLRWQWWVTVASWPGASAPDGSFYFDNQPNMSTSSFLTRLSLCTSSRF
jgi:hypothetical protein